MPGKRLLATQADEPLPASRAEARPRVAGCARRRPLQPVNLKVSRDGRRSQHSMGRNNWPAFRAVNFAHMAGGPGSLVIDKSQAQRPSNVQGRRAVQPDTAE